MPASAVSPPTAVDLDPQGAVGGDAARDHPVSGPARHGVGLAGDHRLVQLCGAIGNGPVDRNAAAGAHQDEVTDAQLVERDRLHAAVGPDALGVVGEQLGECGQRALSLADGPHLHPVAQQHDRDQQRQLPPDLDVEVTEAGRQARGERDHDRHRDQQHHPGLAGASLGHAPGEERPAAVEEDDGAEHGRQPIAAREHRHRVAQPPLQVMAVGHDRHCQHQRHPEAPPEDLGVVAVTRMVGVLAGAVIGAGAVVGTRRCRVLNPFGLLMPSV